MSASDSTAPRLLTDENYHVQIYVNSIAEELKGWRPDGMPKYGQLSLMPLIPRVYDNPLMKLHLGKTACVINETGEVYIYAGFAQKLIDEEIAYPAEKFKNVLFVLLHELFHQYLNHITVAGTLIKRGISMRSANLGADTVMDITLQKYPELKLGPTFDSEFDSENLIITKGFYGTTKEEAKVFGYSSFVEVAEHYQKIENARKKQQENEAKDAKKSKGSSKPKGPGGDGAPSDGGDFGTDHVKSIDDLIDALDKSGLGHLKDILKYPDKNDAAAKEAMRNNQGTILDKVMSDFDTIKARAGKGDHIDNFFQREYQASKPKNVGLNGLEASIANTIGGEFNYTNSELGLDSMRDSEFYSEHYGVDQMPITGSYAPLQEEQTMTIILDTSGSMTMDSRLSDSLAVIVGAAEANPAITGVYLSFADSVTRKLHYFDREDLIQLKNFNLEGFGGTDMAASLALTTCMVRERTLNNKLTIIIHDGDEVHMGDRMPKVQSMVIDKTGRGLDPLICIIPPGCGASEFRRSMANYAEVFEFNEQTTSLEVDVSAAERKTNSIQPGM